MPDSFSDRLNRIAENRAASEGPAPAAPAPRRKTFQPEGRTLPILPVVMAVALTGAAIVAFTQVQSLSASHLTPQGARAQNSADDARYQACFNDPDLRDKLKAQGHTAIDTAVMLMCN